MEPIHNDLLEVNKQNTSLTKKEWHKPEINEMLEINETEYGSGPKEDANTTSAS